MHKARRDEMRATVSDRLPKLRLMADTVDESGRIKTQSPPFTPFQVEQIAMSALCDVNEALDALDTAVRVVEQVKAARNACANELQARGMSRRQVNRLIEEAAARASTPAAADTSAEHEQQSEVERCHHYNGTGHVRYDDLLAEKCWTCNGTGVSTATAAPTPQADAPKCEGVE